MRNFAQLCSTLLNSGHPWMATLSEEVERPPTTAEVTHLQERLRSGSGRPPPSVELVTAALLRAREQAASARAACRLVQGVPTSGYSVKRVGELAELIIPLLPNLGSVDSASPCRPVAAAPSSVPKPRGRVPEGFTWDGSSGQWVNNEYGVARVEVPAGISLHLLHLRA